MRALVCAALLAASAHGADQSTLHGKVMCGYQGWFNCEGDGAELGWVHWTKDGRKGLVPGNAKFDFWPDVSDLATAERFASGFKTTDGRTADVFSSYKEATVLRHFQWMRDYGIDGAFVQRFAAGLTAPKVVRHRDAVLTHCREGAKRFDRTFAVMYDLSGLGPDQMNVVIDDWRRLRAEMHLTDDDGYQQAHGKPLVAVWGVGFSDQRTYTLADCARLVDALKADGCAVMLGVPDGWRELRDDAAPDPALHELLARVDVVSPWTVGRYGDPEAAARHGDTRLKPDVAWCAEHKVDYLPVVFPGFSWHNMYGGPANAIPRRKGQFLWSQFLAAKQAGAEMVYVAMFDEVDEGTAIFKCTNDVPKQEGSKFLTYEGLPSDFYLRLSGAGGRMIRGELPPLQSLPFEK